MANICLYFYLNPTKRLRAFNIFDLGGDGGYFDETPLNTETQMLVQEGFPLFAQELAKLSFRKKQSICGMMFSGAFWEFLDAFQPEGWHPVKALIQQGLIDLIAQPYYNSLNFLIDRDLFQKEVSLAQERITAIQGKKPKSLYHTDLLYNDFLGYWLKRKGFSTTFAPNKVGSWENRSMYQLFHPSHTPDVGVVVPDVELANTIIHGGKNEEELFQYLAHIFGQHHLITLGFDLSELLRVPHTMMKVFRCLGRLQAEGKAHPVSPDEVSTWPKEGGVISQPEFHSIHEKQGTDAWLGTPLQKEAWLTLYSQRSILEAHPFIQNADYFLQMGPQDTERKQHLRAYRQFRSILTDINLKILDKSS